MCKLNCETLKQAVEQVQSSFLEFCVAFENTLQFIEVCCNYSNIIHNLLFAFIALETAPSGFLATWWMLPNWDLGLPQVGFWTSRAKCAATAAQGNTTVFTPVTAVRDSSRGASAETEHTSANLALRWGLLLIYSIFPFEVFRFPFSQFPYWLEVTTTKLAPVDAFLLALLRNQPNNHRRFEGMIFYLGLIIC